MAMMGTVSMRYPTNFARGLSDKRIPAFHNVRTASPDWLAETAHRIQKRNVEIYGAPKGIRTPVTHVRGGCPRPLDDGSVAAVASARPISPVRIAARSGPCKKKGFSQRHRHDIAQVAFVAKRTEHAGSADEPDSRRSSSLKPLNWTFRSTAIGALHADHRVNLADSIAVG